jgi:hypothetical protein
LVLAPFACFDCDCLVHVVSRSLREMYKIVTSAKPGGGWVVNSQRDVLLLDSGRSNKH